MPPWAWRGCLPASAARRRRPRGRRRRCKCRGADTRPPLPLLFPGVRLSRRTGPRLHGLARLGFLLLGVFHLLDVRLQPLLGGPDLGAIAPDPRLVLRYRRRIARRAVAPEQPLVGA